MKRLNPAKWTAKEIISAIIGVLVTAGMAYSTLHWQELLKRILIVATIETPLWATSILAVVSVVYTMVSIRHYNRNPKCSSDTSTDLKPQYGS